jgi:hypothetical protein
MKVTEKWPRKELRISMKCPEREQRSFIMFSPSAKIRDGIVGTATGYAGWGLNPIRVKKSFLHVVQTGSGAHPASYPSGTGG